MAEICGDVKLGCAEKRVYGMLMYSSERHLMTHVHSIVTQHYTEITVEKKKSRMIQGSGNPNYGFT